MIRADRLKELRQARGLSAFQLGEALKLSGARISQLEEGKVDPSCFMLVSLACFFAVSTDYLLGLTDNPTANHSENWEGFLVFSGGGLSSTAWRQHIQNQAAK